ncbi:hypothetical protein [Lentzea sp. CA-135723]|uniref:hypothetical protein n=1 Tax=Lentzea sp. CA-135723 TaxID=3239950 RepID=UPI003D8C24D4
MTPFPRLDQVAGYLSAKGWEVTARWRDGHVWTRDEFDVLLPPGDDTADAAPRLRDLLVCVADAEDRAPSSVAREMSMPDSDVVSYRVVLPGLVPVALATGLRAVKSMRHLITTCARAAADDLPGVDDHAPGRLVERSSMSTADDGFGFDVFVPVFDEAIPFGRATTTLLLRAANIALATTPPVDDLGNGLPAVLADLAGEQRESSFDLAFRWAPALPADRRDISLHFPREFAAKVRVPRERTALPEVARAMVQGRVTRLAHDGSRRVVTIRGTLVLDGRAVNRERTVRVQVEDQQTYLAAVEAHAAERLVRAEGRAEIAGTKYGIAVEPGGFTVVDRERG